MTTPDPAARRAPGAQATSHDAGPAPSRPINHTSVRGGPACPVCSTVLDGGPVQFWCESCRKTVHAADLSHETTRPLVPFRRAAA